MAKVFGPCPACGKRGFYVIHGYSGGLPAGTRRCRYCYHLETPAPAGAPAEPEGPSALAELLAQGP